MTGYDFDKTIYDGDSSTDFFIYMMLTRPYLLLFFPWYLIIGALYGMRIIGKKRLKECLFFFIPWYKNIDRIVDKFWSRNANKIQDWYSFQKKDDDVILSASLSFIVKPVFEMLGIRNWVATNYNTRNGKIYGENCFGDAKLKEYRKQFKGAPLDAFYSDSFSDMPMFKFSDKAYLVTGEEIKELDINK